MKQNASRELTMEHVDTERTNHKVGFWSRVWARWEPVAFAIVTPELGLTLLGIIFLVGLQVVIPSGANWLAWVSVFISTVLAAVAGLLGVYFERALSRSREQSAMITRRQSALRGLATMSDQLVRLEESIVELRRADLVMTENKIETVRKAVTRISQELESQCVGIQESIVKALREWGDVLPGEDVIENAISALQKTRREEQLRSLMELQIQEMSTQIEHLRNDKAASDEEKKQETQRLTKQLNDAKMKLREMEAKATEDARRRSNETNGLRIGVDASRILGNAVGQTSFVVGGAPSYSESVLNVTGGGDLFPVVKPLTITCSKCGNVSESRPSYFGTQKCPKCGEALGGTISIRSGQ